MSSADTEFFAPVYPKVFLINGPPKSGKDTAARYLAEKFDGRTLKFAGPIKRTVTAIYHNNDRRAFDCLDTAEMKDVPQACYFGKSCREAQIGVSEHFLKPFHNDTGIFGKLLTKEIDAYLNRLFSGAFFISDSGFRPEAEELINKYGAQNTFLLRIFRDGYTYKGDSRGYITLKDLGVREFDVQNMDGNLSAFYESLRAIVDNCLHPVTL